MMADTDQALLLSYLGGDGSAFARLIDRHAGLVYGLAVRRTSDPHSARDVAQEVFILLARKANQLLKHPSVAAWLHRTTQNLARDASRAEERHQKKLDRFARHAEAETAADLDSGVLEMIERALAKLPMQEKEVVILRFYEDLDYEEISQHLGISQPAARKRVSRAIVRLQNLCLPHRLALTAGLAALYANPPRGLAASVLPKVVPSNPTTLTLTCLTLMTKATVMKWGLAVVVGGVLLTQWRTNHHLKKDLLNARDQLAALSTQQALPVTESLARSPSKDEADLEKALAEARSLSTSRKEVDLSGVSTMEEKIEKILAELSQWEGYYTPNPVVKQLVELGPEAVEPLLAYLTDTPRGEEPADKNYAGRSATEDALEELLTREDEAKILDAYANHGHLGKLISKYQLIGAREAVFDRIRSGEHVKRSDIAAAITLDPDAALPIVEEYALATDSVNDAFEVAKELDSVPNVDLTPILSHAVGLTGEIPEGLPAAYSLQMKSNLARLALENGVPEAIPLAAEVLRHPETYSFDRRNLAASVRKATNAFGGEDTIPDWLDENSDGFKWDADQRIFVLESEE